MAHWTTLFSHVSGRLEIRKLCNFCGSSSSWGQIQAVSCSWCFHCFICEFIKCLLFFLKFFLQTNQKGTLQSDLRLGSWMSHAPLKTVGVDFICFVSSTELTSCRHHVREDISLLRWHGGGGRRKNWLQYSWAPDWVVQVSFVQQTSWQMTVRCDHGCGMWHALWKRFFLL